MARKSRRVNGNKSVIGIDSTKTPETCAGIYLRLSSKDSADKDSIQNQKAIIESYLYNMPNIKVFKYYIDDGVSSYKDFRPAFEEMMQDIKCGLINTVIVKDISRFGRNYIETGTYLETIFPRIGIRFISVSEGIDSLDQNSKDFEIAIKSLLNHFYAQDISAKVKSVVKQKQIMGEYVAARVPYGYEKITAEGKIKYVTSMEKSVVVKRIFDQTLIGDSYYKIAGLLNLDDIKSPGGNDWTVKAVSRIVNNRFYTGVLEMGKTENTLGGMKPFINKGQNDWIIIDNHHEAIVDTETFEKAQRIIEAKKEKQLNVKDKTTRKNKQIKENQLSKFDKLLFCGDCGRKMKKQVWGASIYYVCPKYSETKGSCSLKSWRLDRIINALGRELEEQVNILEGQPETDELFVSLTEQILLIQKEIDVLKFKRELIYDAFMEGNGYEGKKFRADIDFIDEKINFFATKKDELVHLDNKKKLIDDKIKMLNLFIEELKCPNNVVCVDGPNLDCVVKKIHVYENKLDIAY